MVYETIARSDTVRAPARRYSAFSRVVASDLPLAHLVAAGGGDPCLEVRRLPAAPQGNGARAVYEHYNSRGQPVYRLAYRDGVYLWTYPGVADFAVNRDGRRAGWSADPAREADAAGLLAGPVLGFALQLQGLVGLHGSAVVADGGAVALLGPSGYGKSTAAAALMARGCSLLTDDIAALEVGGERVRLLPSYPKMKLWPQAVDGLSRDLDWQDLPRHVSWLAKRVLPASALGPVCEAARPLSALFVLHPVAGGEVGVQRLRGNHALLALVAQSYNAHLLALEPDVLAHQMSLLAGVAEAVPVYAIQYPQGFDRLSQMVDAVLATARGRPWR